MDQPEHTQSQQSQFGRGWVPLSRDIGIPGETFPSPLPRAGGVGGGQSGICGQGGGFGEEDVAHPQPLPQAGGGQEGEETHPQPLPQAGGEKEEGRHHPNPSSEEEGLLDPRLASHYFTPERQVAFLGHLASHGNARVACAAVGLSPQAAYVHRRRDAAFAQGWEAALVLARQHVEQVLADRALNGVTETIYYRGEAVGQRTRFDSRLLLAHIARLDAHHAASPRGRATAARFDELLGDILAGTADPGELAESRGWQPAFPARADHIAEVVADAEEAFLAATAVPDDEAEESDPPEPDAEEEARLDHAYAVHQAAARAEAAAAWDAHAAARHARIDALVPPPPGEVAARRADGGGMAAKPARETAPPIEFKSLPPIPPCTLSTVSTSPGSPARVAWDITATLPSVHWRAGKELPIQRQRPLAKEVPCPSARSTPSSPRCCSCCPPPPVPIAIPSGPRAAPHGLGRPLRMRQTRAM